MKNKKIENQKLIDSYDYLSNAASSQDCTGLIPSAPTCKEELESYESMYQFCMNNMPPLHSNNGKHTED